MNRGPCICGHWTCSVCRWDDGYPQESLTDQWLYRGITRGLGAYANANIRLEWDQDTLLIAKDLGNYGPRFLADDKTCRAA